MKKITLAVTLALSAALGSPASAYTPTPEQCTQAGAYFNEYTQGCDVAPSDQQYRPYPRFILAEKGVTYNVIAGDFVSRGGTTFYVQSAGTVTFWK